MSGEIITGDITLFHNTPDSLPFPLCLSFDAMEVLEATVDVSPL